MTKHTELEQFLPAQKEPAPRKMISVSAYGYKQISQIAEEMCISRTKTLDALVKFYLEGA